MGGNLVKRKISAIVLSALTAVLVSNWFLVSAKDAAVSVPFKSVPTFSTKNIGRQGHFYVGGKWIGPPGKEIMDGAMYVEVWVPKKFGTPIPFCSSWAGGTIEYILAANAGRAASAGRMIS